jgi:hypothetical protein
VALKPDWLPAKTSLLQVLQAQKRDAEAKALEKEIGKLKPTS